MAGTPREVVQRLAPEIAKWGNLVRDTGAKLD